MALFTVDHVGLLLRKLKEVQCQAKDFGIKLGLNYSAIETVGKQPHKTPHECLQQMFSLWQKQPSKQRTWKILVQALRYSGEQVIASKIEGSYTLDQSVPVELDLLQLVDGINPSHWRSLGLDLGLSVFHIEQIDDKGGHNEYLMFTLLCMWVKGNGKPATMETLVTAMKELQYYDLSDRLAADEELQLSPCSSMELFREHSDVDMDTISKSVVLTTSNKRSEELKPHNFVVHSPSDLNSLLQKYNISQANVEKSCDDNLFLTLLPQLSRFEDTAPYFGFTQPEIEEIQIDKTTERSRKLSMLWKWRSKNGSGATYLAIMEVFLSMRDKNLAEIVLQHFKQCQPQLIDSCVYPEKVSKYGNWNRKRKAEQEQIKNLLFVENQNIREKFASLVQHILQSFKSSNVSLKHLKMFLYSYGIPVNTPTPHAALLPHFESATDLDDAFLIVSRDYSSWLNIQLLKVIVKSFGSNRDQEKIKAYEGELVVYLQRSIYEIPSKSIAPGHENAGLISLFVLLPNKGVPSGEDVVNITRNLSRLLCISDGILQFISFEDCSILLIFGVPEQLLRINALQSLVQKYFTFDVTKKGYTFNDDLALILPVTIIDNASGLDALNRKAVAKISIAREYVDSQFSQETQPTLARDEELQIVQNNLLGKLPDKKPYPYYREQKKPEWNNSSRRFLQCYHVILEIFSKNIEISEPVAEKLKEAGLIDAVERDQVKTIACEPIKIRALMRAVDIMIKKAVRPHTQLQKFVGVLSLYKCFSDVVHGLKEEYEPIKPVNKTDVPQMSHPDETKVVETCFKTDIDTDREIHKYAEYLRALYQTPELQQKPLGWPFVKESVFVDLTIADRDHHVSQVTTSTGNVENKGKGHKVVKLHQLVECTPNSPACILITGAPGIGKSSLAIEICKKWSVGELYNHFKLVIHLSLRDPNVQTAEELEDLIQKRYQKCIEPLVDCLGMGVLFILEGYDELPEAQRENGLFLNLITGRELPKASVMVTSRPWATLSISRYFKKQVEILGFTKGSRMEYITSVLSDDEASAFKRELTKLSSIRGCLNVPLYLVTLVEIYRGKEGSKLPETVAQLYNVLINTQLQRYIRSEKSQEIDDVPVGEFYEYPKDLYVKFLNICEIAYEATITGCFPKLPKKFETLNLLYNTPDPHICLASGVSQNYSFLHSSVREFLAAYYISRKAPHDINQHIKQMQLARFSLVIEFLSGFHKNDVLANTRVPPEVKNFYIFRQLCETQDDKLIKDVLKEPRERTILRTWPVPTPHDFWCLGRCIGFSECIWELGFTFRHLQGEHLVMLCEGIKSVEDCRGRIKTFNISLNELDIEGLSHIFDLPPQFLSKVEFINLRGNHLNVLPIPKHGFHNFTSLHTFLFHDNDITFDGHHPLIQALKAVGIQRVSFSNLSGRECALLLSIPSLETVELWQICSTSITAVVTAIAGNIKLKSLEINQSKIDCRNVEQLPWFLPTSRITSLVFSNCAIDSNTADIIAQAVTRSESIQKLDLSDNMISHKGGQALVNLLQINRSLMELNLVHNPLSRDNVYWLRRMKPRCVF